MIEQKQKRTRGRERRNRKKGGGKGEAGAERWGDGLDWEDRGEEETVRNERDGRIVRGWIIIIDRKRKERKKKSIRY